MTNGKIENRPLSIFSLSLIFTGLVIVTLMLFDRSNYMIYSEIILFIAFLFFLVRGSYYLKIDNYKHAIMCYAVVVIIMITEMIKVLLYSGVL